MQVTPRLLIIVIICAVALMVFLWHLSRGGSVSVPTPIGPVNVKGVRRRAARRRRTASGTSSLPQQRSARNSNKVVVAGFAIILIAALGVFYKVVTSVPSTLARGPRTSPHASASPVTRPASVSKHFSPPSTNVTGRGFVSFGLSLVIARRVSTLPLATDTRSGMW